MPLFEIDRDKCQKDGVCRDACPVYVIKQKENKYPEPAPNAEKICIQCGHCVAACPHGAFSHKHVPLEQCRPVKEALRVSAEQAEQLFKARRSIRNFKDMPASKERLEKLLDMARMAPSGKNTRSFQWIVAQNPDDTREMAKLVIDWMRMMIEKQPELAKAERLDSLVTLWDHGRDPICHGAPHVVFAAGRKDDRRALPACMIAAAHIDLAAPSLGLGTCWAGYLNFVVNQYPPLVKKIGLDDGRQVFASLLVGVPMYQYRRIPVRPPHNVKWL